MFSGGLFQEFFVKRAQAGKIRGRDFHLWLPEAKFLFSVLWSPAPIPLSLMVSHGTYSRHARTSAFATNSGCEIN